MTANKPCGVKFGELLLLFIFFIALKLIGVISRSRWWELSPLWFYFALFTVLFFELAPWEMIVRLVKRFTKGDAKSGE